ncbi:hypothetical protein BaRGS_00035630, partial [Batillaria attramentaria]
KLDILTKGREKRKEMDISVAGDLTERQQATLKRYRDGGIRAYYMGDRLVSSSQSLSPLSRQHQPQQGRQRERRMWRDGGWQTVTTQQHGVQHGLEPPLLSKDASDWSAGRRRHQPVSASWGPYAGADWQNPFQALSELPEDWPKLQRRGATIPVSTHTLSSEDTTTTLTTIPTLTTTSVETVSSTSTSTTTTPGVLNHITSQPLAVIPVSTLTTSDPATTTPQAVLGSSDCIVPAAVVNPTLPAVTVTTTDTSSTPEITPSTCAPGTVATSSSHEDAGFVQECGSGSPGGVEGDSVVDMHLHVSSNGGDDDNNNTKMDRNNSTDNTDANASLHARKETGRSLSRGRQKDGVLPPGQTHLPSAWKKDVTTAADRSQASVHNTRRKSGYDNIVVVRLSKD